MSRHVYLFSGLSAMLAIGSQHLSFESQRLQSSIQQLQTKDEVFRGRISNSSEISEDRWLWMMREVGQSQVEPYAWEAQRTAPTSPHE